MGRATKCEGHPSKTPIIMGLQEETHGAIWGSVRRTLLKPIVKLLLCIVVVQLCYWALLSPHSQRPALSGLPTIDHVDVAALEEANLAAVRELDDGVWQQEEIFWYGCCEQTHYAFRYTFPLGELPSADLGLIASFGADNYHVWVNGYPVIDEGKLAPHSTYHARWTRGVQRVSKAMLRQGNNEVIAITARNGGGYTDLFPQFYGDYQAMLDMSAKRTFMLNDFRIATLILFALLALIITLLVPYATDKRFLVWFAILAWALTLRLAYYRWWEPPLSAEWLTAYYFGLTALIAVAWFNFVRSWCRNGWRHLTIVLNGSALLGIFFTTLLILADRHQGSEVADNFAMLLNIAAGVGGAVMLLHHVYRNVADRPWEMAVLLLGLTAMVMDAGYELLLQKTEGNLQFAQPFLMLSFIIVLLTRNLRLLENTKLFNHRLNSALVMREAELAKNYAELQDAQRVKDLQDERQRILRDVHDGIGSRLTGLVVQARAQDVDQAEMLEAVEDSLNDLHLVVHSLDFEPGQYIEMFESLKNRLQKQAEFARMKLDWDVKPPTNPLFEKDDFLHLFRIIQEAATNVFRHSNASHVNVVSTQGVAGYRMCIEDNGVNAHGGEAGCSSHGLKSMQFRAAQLGGTVKFEASKQGFSVRLTIGAT